MNKKVFNLCLGAALLLLASLCGQSSANAKSINVEEAELLAYSFWGKTAPRKTRALASVSFGKNGAFYVFNNEDGGFVIIAGNDAVPAVLGYSENGSFDGNDVPTGLAMLLKHYECQINALSSQSLGRKLNAEGSPKASSKYLQTALWNQDEPYNKFVYNNYPTGSIATAMGIVMRYNKYPYQGTGKISYTSNGQKYSVDLSAHTYDWDSMPTDIYTSANADKYEGVAQLLSDCGIAARTSYGLQESTSSISWALYALIYNFGYSPFSVRLYMDQYTEEEWQEKLKAEIDADRPVIYEASDDSQGAHAFVVDGYDGQGRFSINWGWGARYNGTYVLGDFSPYKGAEYNLKQGAIFNLKPATGTEQVCPMRFIRIKDQFYGTNMNVTDVKAGQKFYVYAHALQSQTDNKNGYDGCVVPALVNSKGEVRAWLCNTMNMLNLKSGYYLSYVTVFPCVSNVDAEPGDYITFFTRDKGSAENDVIKMLTFDNEEFRIPATGYTPKMTQLNITTGKGAEVALDTDFSATHPFGDKYLLGSSFRFNVVLSGNIEKYSVLINGKQAEMVEFGTNRDKFYFIENSKLPNYEITVRTYEDYEEKTAEVATTAGNLKTNVEQLNLDYYVYTGIKVRGEIDERDFLALNEMGFKHIDLSECQVVAYKKWEANAIPSEAFENNTHLVSFIMPKGVEHIGEYAFYKTKIEAIDLPESITDLGNNAFSQCDSLKNVTMHWSEPISINASVFRVYGNYKRTLHVPEGTQSTYRANYGYRFEWGMYFTALMEDAPTDIKNVEADGRESTESNSIYTLDGKRVVKTEKKNIYIVNGKKILVQ